MLALFFERRLECAKRRFERSATGEAAGATSAKIAIVCKYWLRDRCMMGDDCKFAHSLTMARLQWCKYVSSGQPCPDGPDCVFRHE
jgi:hypothetical protein